MSLLNPGQIRGTPIPIFNGYAPEEKMGPRALPVVLDFTNTAVITADAVLELNLGTIGAIQGIYVDNYNNPNPFEITFAGTTHHLRIPLKSQAFMPIFVAEGCQFTATTVQGVKVPIILVNIPVGAMVWATP